MDAFLIDSYPDLVQAIRDRQDELRLSCLAIDELSGLASGHYSKLTCGAKQIGLRTIFLLLPAMGLRMRIEPDPDAIARYGPRWQPRDERFVRHRPQMSTLPTTP
jgi:hypothetical protein